MDAGSTRYIANLSSIFWDPNGDNLAYFLQFSTSSLNFIADSLILEKLYLQAGSNICDLVQTIITATDKDNHSVSDSFFVTINNNAIQLPETPILSSPADGSTVSPINTEFAWQQTAQATSYHLQIANDSQFSQIIYKDSLLTSTQCTLNILESGKSYFWRVKAKNTSGASTFAVAEKLAHKKCLDRGDYSSARFSLDGWSVR